MSEEFYKKTIVGTGSKMKMDSEGVEIFEYKIPEYKSVDLLQEKKFIYSYFLIEGNLKINNKKIEKGDFFKVQADEKVILQSLSASKVFVIKSPIKTGYLTYAEKRFV